ncbi:hypothetical protein PTTG_30219, partial [Puccinia triticina 1-1 BBBD Race 1]
MKESTSLGKVLTAGSKSLFDAIEELRPNSFKPGRFASCDLFIESVLDPSKNKCRVLRTLFSVNEHRVFTCALHHSQVDHSRGNQLLTVLRITNLMFDSNSISRTNPAELITLWSTNGLTGQSGLHCRDCLAEPKKKRTRKTKKIEPESLVEPQTLEQLSVIRTPEDAKPPAHLHFHIETATLLEEEDQKKFMSEMNWPFKITVFGEEYTLISRGFFGYSHYWGKVLRYANGLMGVWRHDDQLNAGRAYMLDPIPGSISGAQDDTSWLIYSRCWTPEEAAFVNKGTGQILKDNPQFPNNIPFTRMHSILTVAYNGELAHNPSAGAAPRDELARNDPGGPDAQGPVQSLKIRIRRPATTAPAAEISPMKGVQLTLAPAPDEFSASNPAPAVRFAPEKRGRPPRKVPAASLDISASSLAPAVQFAPAKRARPSEAISSSDAPAATFDNPPAKRIRPNKVEAASQPVAQASLVGILPAKRKVGRPKKAAQVNTSYTFRPEPLNSADWERTQARSQAYWKDHCT